MKKNIILLIILILFGSMVMAQTVDELNPKFSILMDQAMKPINLSSYGYQKELQPLSLFVFSDIHGDKTELKRYCDFLENNKNYFKDAICLGDSVEFSLKSDWNYWKETLGAEKILLTVGNHDALNDHVGWDFSNLLSMQGVYNHFFAPFIKNWNCTYEEGKTYYYKDYNENKVRLIVLDCMLKEQDRTDMINWFNKTISDTLKKDFALVIGYHYPLGNDLQKIKSKWTDINIPIAGDVQSVDLLVSVQKFIDGGGEFVAWICGHTHTDFLAFSKSFPKQLMFVVGATNREQGKQYSSNYRYDGTQAQDLADAVIIDRSIKTLKAVRIGSHYDSNLREINSLCINYKTLEIINEN